MAIIGKESTYIWHPIDDLTGVQEDRDYILCIENGHGPNASWHMMFAKYYEKGSEVVLREANGSPHHFTIQKTGFYIINDAGKDKFTHIYLVHNITYWTEIEMPSTNPDDVLTIEN